MNKPEYIFAGWMIAGCSAPVQRHILLTVTDDRLSSLDFNKKDTIPATAYDLFIVQLCCLLLTVTSTLGDQVPQIDKLVINLAEPWPIIERGSLDNM